MMYDDNPFGALDRAISEIVRKYEGQSILLLGRTAYVLLSVKTKNWFLVRVIAT